LGALAAVFPENLKEKIMKKYDEIYAMKSVDDFVFMSQQVEDKIKDLVSGDMPFPVAGKNGILLHGAVGTGKTTLAKLLPDAIEARFSGNSVDEIFCSISQGGSNGAQLISNILAITERVPLWASNHYFVLDEVDRLRPNSMESLRSIMGNPNSVFIFTTNHLNKIEASVKSRCHLIQCDPAPDYAWLKVVKHILENEGVGGIYCDQALLTIISACNGCARDILSATYRLAVKAHKLLSDKAA
jgi:DNA polymerase III delta prime subunit